MITVETSLLAEAEPRACCTSQRCQTVFVTLCGLTSLVSFVVGVYYAMLRETCNKDCDDIQMKAMLLLLGVFFPWILLAIVRCISGLVCRER